MAEKKKIILDVDTGTDDAIAIMTAYLDPNIDLIAVCTVAGNKALPYHHGEHPAGARIVLQADFPVYKGCSEAHGVSTLLPNRHGGYSGQRTMVEGMDEPIEIHTDYLELPPSIRTVEKEHAVWFYIDTLMHSDGDITLVPVGPADQHRHGHAAGAGDLPRRSSEIVLMGGGYERTNTSAAAEFNIWADPEAAQIVMDSGCPITHAFPWTPPTAGAASTPTRAASSDALGTSPGQGGGRLRRPPHPGLQPPAAHGPVGLRPHPRRAGRMRRGPPGDRYQVHLYPGGHRHLRRLCRWADHCETPGTYTDRPRTPPSLWTPTGRCLPAG